MSKNTIDYHYGKLAKGYVDRYNNREGDREFNEAGAFLHNIFFSQFRTPRPSNLPIGAIKTLIEKKHKDFKEFKDEFKEQALKVQGSGWIYLSKNGDIKTIKNHQIRQDIVFLVDMWEHSYNLDYGANKKGYLDKIWQIIDWTRVNTRVVAGK
jgi:Fe-Mn family superoxide dismutase